MDEDDGEEGGKKEKINWLHIEGYSDKENMWEKIVNLNEVSKLNSGVNMTRVSALATSHTQDDVKTSKMEKDESGTNNDTTSSQSSTSKLATSGI